MEKPKLLIVEDDPSIATQMKWALAKDYEVLLAEDRSVAMEIFLKEHPSVVTLDLGLPPNPGEVKEGFLALAEMLSHDSLTKIIVITGQGEKRHALEAIGEGAYDFFCKPIQIDELKVVLGRAFYVSQLEREYRKLKQQLRVESFEGMLGTSSKMQEVFSSIRKVATTDVPVLIVGESGTGKELVARAIFKNSSRWEYPFVVINCSAIPETLLESELFGHEKGAFTGAHIQRKGRFEMAQGGTLFLDEIGELSLPLQVKLLRFLQEQKIERVGGREGILVDARVLTATNKDLSQAIKEGKFREDLYYRLCVVTITLPPLREREGDVLLLATALLQKYADENKKSINGFTPQAIETIKTYSWPGNIRELENRLRRAVIMAENKKVTPMDLELDYPYSKYESKGLKEAREALEKELIQRTLIKNKGNMSKTAEELGVSRPTLYELMGKLGIEK
ncbi:MAG: PEP-CTERM-box response regulator transcription factor [Syntrophaceae bacterium]|nr:PEP-CTERM-box response regulator transcription factor [Syntrophaceae bacterium]